MKRKIYLSVSLLVLCCAMMLAQSAIKGRVVDMENNGIDGVAVILQTPDSVYVDATVSDSSGLFSFTVGEGKFRLLFQHLLYEVLEKEITSNNLGIIQLKEKELLLDEVVVKGERPQVKVEGGTLIYDAPALVENKAVTNAFEVIKELPGITGANDEIALLGASNLSIILNGQLTTLSLEQLIGLLKTIPASRVVKAEVMYNAPAKYNVKGALINVIIEETADLNNIMQGEVGTDYEQRHYASGKMRANLLYSTSNLSIDLLVNGGKGRNYGGEDMFARHILDDKTVEINQINRGSSKSTNGSTRVGIDYTLKNKDRLSGSYYLQASASDAERFSNSTFTHLQEGTKQTSYSTTTSDDNSTLQNAKIQYTGHQGITAGTDFTNYKNPDEQRFTDRGEAISPTNLIYNTKQNISKWQVFANHTYTIKEDWQLNYGANGGLSDSRTKIAYTYSDENRDILLADMDSDNKQKEYSGSLFAEMTHAFGEHFSATLSLKGEYFRSDYTSNGQEKTLWSEGAFFPNGSFSYTFSPYHIMQLNISSDKNYPSYWSVNPQISYINSYTEIHGNPELKPSRAYNGQLLYILKQKYVLLFSTSYNPDHFTQLPYQSATEMKNVFRFENLDFAMQNAIGAIIPVRFGQVLDSRFTLNGIRFQQKSDHFFDLPFNNKKYAGYVRADNTFSLSDNVKLNVSSFYLSSALQGIYKLGTVYDVSAALKWTFAEDKGTMTVKYNNIFRSNIPRSIIVETGNQYSRMKNIDDSRYLGISFSWKFGGYKEKKHEKVDDSRFGK